jgi:nitrogen fixation protein FixH
MTLAPRKITGRQVAVAVIGFFVVITAIDGWMAYTAVSTFGGGDTQDAYRKGLRYNERIAEARSQDAIGWSDKVSFESNSGLLRLVVSDKDGKPIEGLNVVAKIGRPATNAHDNDIALKSDSPGTYVAWLPALEAGTWFAAFEARKAGADGADVAYRTKARLWRQP